MIEEAILQGFLELVERDGVAIWWYNRLSSPRVDVHLWNDSGVGRGDGPIAQMGREIWVLDVTTDLGIPTFAAVACNAGVAAKTGPSMVWRAPDAQVALSRALTELTQSLPAV